MSVHNWNMNTSHSHCEYCNVLIDWVETHKGFTHSEGIKAEQWTGRLTYLAQGIPWSIRRFLQVETQALHFAELKLAISPNVGDSGAQFLVGGDCVRASPACYNSNRTRKLLTISQVCLPEYSQCSKWLPPLRCFFFFPVSNSWQNFCTIEEVQDFTGLVTRNAVVPMHEQERAPHTAQGQDVLCFIGKRPVCLIDTT